MKVKILRQVSPESKPYWESFEYDGPKDNSIAGLLEYLNYNDDIITDDGQKTTRIGWECSCLQGVCGACAMVINEVPALACETFLKDLKGDVITIRPLRKFPVIHDLVTDRSIIQENLKQTNMFIGEYSPDTGKDHERQYKAAKCLKCGLCLEVCPNYTNGQNFFGALYANDCHLIAARNKEKAADIKKNHAGHFAAGCSKSFACMDVCPMGIDII